MTDIYECIETGCKATPTHVVRTDRLWTVLEVCEQHIGWVVQFFMSIHNREVEPFVIAPIAFHAEARISVPMIKADLLDEAARRIHDEIAVQNRSEELVRTRAIEVLREMCREPRT
ncbi:hypothetical protein ABZX85_47615 [Streptomyces sp. NPDC004539]|uniref:hypothetical protein n=1 Tax=Streptomyces sp. NPDC004539 TaxID=3154280 RepID=UPI0033B9E4CC